MGRRFVLSVLVVLLLCGGRARAQLSPPGLGDAVTASWAALGVRQDLDAEETWQLTGYAGYGRTSREDSLNPAEREAIAVLNGEVMHTLRPNLFYSFALSYRRQDEYDGDMKDDLLTSSYQRELRGYGRVGYVARLGRMRLSAALRPELRTFFHDVSEPDDEVLELRMRAKLQLQWAIDRAAAHRVVLSAELLAAMDREEHGPFGAFKYRESRFCLYYSLTPRNAAVTIDVGYMNDLIQHPRGPHGVHYLAFDVIWDNPFGLP